MKPKPFLKQLTKKRAVRIILYLLWVLIGIIIGQLFIGILMYSALGSSFSDNPLWMTIYTAASYTITCFIVIFLPATYRNSKLSIVKKDLGLLGMLRWRDIGLAIVGFVAFYFLATLLTNVFSAIFPWFEANQAQNIGFTNLIDPYARFLAVISLVLIVPVAEELLFRGWLYTKIRKHANLWITTLLVSALFALVHGAWNVGIVVFAMSIIMCLLREFTGTIWSSIFIHILKNALALFILLQNGII